MANIEYLQKHAVSQYQLTEYHSKAKKLFSYDYVELTDGSITTYTVSTPTQNILYDLTGSTDGLTLLDISGISATTKYEVVIFFHTNTSSTMTLTVGTNQRIVGDIDLEKDETYVMSVFHGAIVCQAAPKSANTTYTTA